MTRKDERAIHDELHDDGNKPPPWGDCALCDRIRFRRLDAGVVWVPRKRKFFTDKDRKHSDYCIATFHQLLPALPDTITEATARWSDMPDQERLPVPLRPPVEHADLELMDDLLQHGGLRPRLTTDQFVPAARAMHRICLAVEPLAHLDKDWYRVLDLGEPGVGMVRLDLTLCVRIACHRLRVGPQLNVTTP